MSRSKKDINTLSAESFERFTVRQHQLGSQERKTGETHVNMPASLVRSASKALVSGQPFDGSKSSSGTPSSFSGICKLKTPKFWKLALARVPSLYASVRLSGHPFGRYERY